MHRKTCDEEINNFVLLEYKVDLVFFFNFKKL